MSAGAAPAADLLVRHIDSEERRARLAVRHHLVAPGPDVDTVAGDLIGIHSSDPVTVYLTAWARLKSFRRDDLETALYDRRTLLRMLGMRRTMFVVPHDVAAAMHVACAREFVAGERRRLIRWLEGEGITSDGDDWITHASRGVLASLAKRGEATASELKQDVPALEARIAFGGGKKWSGTVGMSTRILFLLATSGEIIRARPRGSWVSSQYRWTVTDDWVPGGLPHISTEAAEQDLVRRWLHTYGPGTETDLVWWTGWGKRRIRTVLAAVDAVEVTLDAGQGYVLPDDVEPALPIEPWIALLPSLDSTVMGWKDRDWYVGQHAPVLYDRNGNAGPTIWVDGRIVGGWGQRQDGDVAFRLLEDVSTETANAVAAKAARLTEWLGDTRIKARFPTPLEKSILD